MPQTFLPLLPQTHTHTDCREDKLLTSQRTRMPFAHFKSLPVDCQ